MPNSVKGIEKTNARFLGFGLFQMPLGPGVLRKWNL